jgi:hypothetical protein
MDQFAAERNAEKLCIRYVSGRRKQNFFALNNFREPCNHPNLYAAAEHASLLQLISTKPREVLNEPFSILERRPS